MISEFEQRKRLDEAIRTVAGSIIGDLLSRDGAVSWEDYPDIGEHDWEQVSARVRTVVFNSTPPAYRLSAARALLAARAAESAADDQG